MNRVDPEDCLGALDRLDIEIDHHGLLAAAHHHAGQRGVRRGVVGDELVTLLGKRAGAQRPPHDGK